MPAGRLTCPVMPLDGFLAGMVFGMALGVLINELSEMVARRWVSWRGRD